VLEGHVGQLALHAAVGQLQGVGEVPVLNGVVDGLRASRETEGRKDG